MSWLAGWLAGWPIGAGPHKNALHRCTQFSFAPPRFDVLAEQLRALGRDAALEPVLHQQHRGALLGWFCGGKGVSESATTVCLCGKGAGLTVKKGGAEDDDGEDAAPRLRLAGEVLVVGILRFILAWWCAWWCVGLGAQQRQKVSRSLDAFQRDDGSSGFPQAPPPRETTGPALEASSAGTSFAARSV